METLQNYQIESWAYFEKVICYTVYMAPMIKTGFSDVTGLKSNLDFSRYFLFCLYFINIFGSLVKALVNNYYYNPTITNQVLSSCGWASKNHQFHAVNMHLWVSLIEKKKRGFTEISKVRLDPPPLTHCLTVFIHLWALLFFLSFSRSFRENWSNNMLAPPLEILAPPCPRFELELPELATNFH